VLLDSFELVDDVGLVLMLHEDKLDHQGALHLIEHFLQDLQTVPIQLELLTSYRLYLHHLVVEDHQLLLYLEDLSLSL